MARNQIELAFKEIIRKKSKDFDGGNNDLDVMAIIKNTVVEVEGKNGRPILRWCIFAFISHVKVGGLPKQLILINCKSCPKDIYLKKTEESKAKTSRCF